MAIDPVDDLSYAEFKALTPEARAEWFYASTDPQRRMLIDAAVAAGAGREMIVDAGEVARRRLGSEIAAAQHALADSMQRTYDSDRAANE